jgi:hypothetical protein
MSPAEETTHTYFWVLGAIGLAVVIVFSVVMAWHDRKRRAARRAQRRASRRHK